MGESSTRNVHPMGADAVTVENGWDRFNAEFLFFGANVVFPECHGLTFGVVENKIRIG